MWDGYKLHLTESCDAHLPHLVLFAATNPGSTDDHQVTAAVHRHLAERGLVPGEHLVDGGYTSARLIPEARAAGIELTGPVRLAVAPPGLPGGYTPPTSPSTGTSAAPPARAVPPPAAGSTPPSVASPAFISTSPSRGCPKYPLKHRCASAAYRVLTLPPRAEYDILQQRRADQDSDAWKERHRTRVGVGGGISQAVHRTCARRTRYQSLPKTALGHVLTAAALNPYSLDAWWTGTPLGKTRVSDYEQLTLTLAA